MEDNITKEVIDNTFKDNTPKVTQQLLFNLVNLGWSESQIDNFINEALENEDIRSFKGIFLNEWNHAIFNPLRKPKAGKETYTTPEDNWNELSSKEKEERLSGIETSIDSFIDLNTISKDVLVEDLYNQIKFRSDSDSYIICYLIDYYKKNSRKHISSKPEMNLFKDAKNWGEE